MGSVAVCLSCGNEWSVRKEGVKKRKCPVCGKYRVKMKADIEKEKEKEGEEPAGPAPVPAPVSHQEGEEEEEKEKEGEPAGVVSVPAPVSQEGEEEKEEKAAGSGLVFVALVGAAALIGWFLWCRCRARRSEDEIYGYPEEEITNGGCYAGF